MDQQKVGLMIPLTTIRYTKNSKGETVVIQEKEWADEDETPTHLVLQFASSHGGAYIGSPGNTLWVDNVRLVYDEKTE